MYEGKNEIKQWKLTTLSYTCRYQCTLKYGSWNSASWVDTLFIKTEKLQCRLCFSINLSFYDYPVINFSLYIYIYIYIYMYNIYYHLVVPLARISLTLSHHFSLSFIASGWSSGLHPVCSHSCWMYVRAGRPALARPYVGVHRSTSLMSSFLLF